MRTGQKPVDQTGIRGCRAASETVFAAIEALDFELLTGLYAILLSYLSRQDNLPFG
jgi:hypothetical protein